MRISVFCIAALAGCGHSSNGATPDASPPAIDTPPDTTIDTLACTPTSATGKVTVDGPSSTAALVVTFIVHDPTGAVVSRSDPAGPDATVMLDVPSCGMVSVVDKGGSGGASHVMTWTNVQPGDHLVSLERTTPTVPRDIAVTVPGVFSATEYDLLSSCAPNHFSFTTRPDSGDIAFTAQCTPSPAAITVVATAKTSSAPAYAVASMAIADSGTTTVTMSPLDPAPPSMLTLYHASSFTTARYVTYASPSGNPVEIGGVMATVSGDSVTVPNAPALQGQGAIEIIAGDTSRVTRLLRPVTTLPPTIELDGNELLSLVSGTVDTATARPTVVWSTDVPAQADEALVEIDQDGSGKIEWELAAPPVPGSIRFPEMPVDLWPAAAPTLSGVGIFESSAITGFAAGNIRALLFDFPLAGVDVRISTSGSAAALRRRR